MECGSRTGVSDTTLGSSLHITHTLTLIVTMNLPSFETDSTGFRFNFNSFQEPEGTLQGVLFAELKHLMNERAITFPGGPPDQDNYASSYYNVLTAQIQEVENDLSVLMSRALEETEVSFLNKST